MFFVLCKKETWDMYCGGDLTQDNFSHNDNLSGGTLWCAVQGFSRACKQNKTIGIYGITPILLLLSYCTDVEPVA
jgi:hypothetical protein